MTKVLPSFPDFDYVTCEHCGLKVSGPFQATMRSKNPKNTSYRGQCTGQYGCKGITEFFLWCDPPENVQSVGDLIGLKRSY